MSVSLKYIGLILLDLQLECCFRGVAIVLSHSTAGYSPVVGLMPESCFWHRRVHSLRPRGGTLLFDAESLRGCVSCADRIFLARLRLFDVSSSLAAPLGRSGPARFGSCNANLTLFLGPAEDAIWAPCPTAFNILRIAGTSLLSSDSSSLSLEVDISVIRTTSAM